MPPRRAALCTHSQRSSVLSGTSASEKSPKRPSLRVGDDRTVRLYGPSLLDKSKISLPEMTSAWVTPSFGSLIADHFSWVGMALSLTFPFRHLLRTARFSALQRLSYFTECSLSIVLCRWLVLVYADAFPLSRERPFVECVRVRTHSLRA